MIGERFHNPYTFLPFESDGPIRERRQPTLLTADEQELGEDRFTGVLRLAITTTSPLKSCKVEPEDPNAAHPTYRAMTIGNDVIVPATGVRGALRTLMTILTSGTLGYVDTNAFLVQGRDINLGPPTQRTTGRVPDRVFMAEVVTAGNYRKSGTIRLGDPIEPELIHTSNLESLSRTQWSRKADAAPVWIGFDKNDEAVASDKLSDEFPYRLRLSGDPVGKGRQGKNEALYKPSKNPDDIIELPSQYWSDYCGRHAASDACKELKAGHLVWLEMTDEFLDSGRKTIQVDDINSLQWARLGRSGRKIEDATAAIFLPDSWKDDGKVDEVTDLFGQVADERSNKKAISFAARVRPENLVFPDAASQCEATPLAPLMMPHPGCIAFYDKDDNPSTADGKKGLRGYKVYRTSRQSGAEGPWHYDHQSIYQRMDKQPVGDNNQTAYLLPPDTAGTLNIAVRGLSQRELALLHRACCVPWRLGGGKPLGLGACNVKIVGWIDELGEPFDPAKAFGDDWLACADDIDDRVLAWKASQQPVDKLRYPRAGLGNSRGGHAWFMKHAKPRMSGGIERDAGLQAINVTDPLKQELAEGTSNGPDKIDGQCLPFFNPNDPDGDWLYGYDLLPEEEKRDKVTYVKRFQKLDE